MMKVDFLISSERSGSNLITKILDNHSSYCGPTPPHLLRVFSAKMSTYNNLNNNINWNNFISDILDFFNYKIGVWSSSINKNELLEITPRNLSEVVKFIYSKEAKLHQKKRVFIKEVRTYNIYHFLKSNFDAPKFIWLVRDPRDMALSWSESPVHRGDIIRAAKIWKEDQSKTLTLFKEFKKNILLINYEALLVYQEDVLKQICLFLDIPFESTMLEFHKSKVSKENAIQTDNWKNLDKEIINNNFKKYRKKLSQNQIQYIEYLCQKEMATLDYKLDFPLLTEQEFLSLEIKLLKKERNEKPEYLLISDTEKEKRKMWHNKYIEIQGK